MRGFDGERGILRSTAGAVRTYRRDAALLRLAWEGATVPLTEEDVASYVSTLVTLVIPR